VYEGAALGNHNPEALLAPPGQSVNVIYECLTRSSYQSYSIQHEAHMK
jgi:hypothetical protein